jgi:hypothetical protein
MVRHTLSKAAAAAYSATQRVQRYTQQPVACGGCRAARKAAGAVAEVAGRLLQPRAGRRTK